MKGILADSPTVRIRALHSECGLTAITEFLIFSFLHENEITVLLFFETIAKINNFILTHVAVLPP